MRKDLQKVSVFALVLVMTVVSFSCIPNSGMASVRGPYPTMARLHVNVTYPDGGPASYVYLRVHNYDNPYSNYYSDKGTTNNTGQEWIDITSWNLGPCYLTVYNYSKSSFSRFRIDIWPDDETYLEVVLSPSLEDEITLMGTVYNKTAGSPIPQTTTIMATGEDTLGNKFQISNLTQEDGSYRIDMPPSEKMVLINAVVSHPSIEFLPFSSHFFFDPDMKDHHLDIELSMIHVMDVPVDLRLMDSNKGAPVDDNDMVKYRGYEIGNDHGKLSDHYIWSGMNGWRNLTLGNGEYIFTWRHDYNDPLNCQVSADIPLYVNSTPISEEIPIPIPSDFRNIEIKVLDHTTGQPLYGATISFSYQIERSNGPAFGFSSAYITSNNTGIAHFGILSGQEVKIKILRWDREVKIITIPPGQQGEDLNITVRLKEKQLGEPVYGNISARVKEKISGIPIPYAHVMGKGSDEYPFLSFEGLTDKGGYFNSTVQVGTYDITAESSLGSGKRDGVAVSFDDETALEIELERRSFENKLHEIGLMLMDPEGNPVPHQPITFTPIESGVGISTGSNDEGIVRASLPFGEYILDNINNFRYFSLNRPKWVIPEMTRISVTEEGELGPLTVYPANSLNEISGTVKELGTGKTLPFKMIEASSEDDEGVLLFKETSGSQPDGYYRTWGTGLVEISSESEGYFPHKEILDLHTRSTKIHDIVMEPMLDHSTWINGTIVDSNDEPIKGEVQIIDIDRNDFIVNTNSTSLDGRFSMSTYPGRFRIEYSNLTLENQIYIDVSSDGLNDLKLILLPLTTITGVVSNWSGEPIQNVKVELLQIGSEINVSLEEIMTDKNRGFTFQVEAGTYMVGIEGSDLLDGWNSGLLIATGWNKFDLNIGLSNRTTSTVTGTVFYDGGPFSGGISGSKVKLLNELGNIVGIKDSDLSGNFRFEKVPHGSGYRLEAEPPLDLKGLERTYRSGLFSNSMISFEVSGMGIFKDIYLPYFEFTPPGYFNITNVSPTGAGIFVDEPIRMSFSSPINRTSLAENLHIMPEVNNLTYIFDPVGKSIEVHHDPFDPVTGYSISVSTDLLSMGDLKLWGNGPFLFNFTTGSEKGAWRITASFVDVDTDKEWNITAIGPKDQEVYIVIEGVGSFPLEEGYRSENSSEYTISIDGENFEWNTTYAYHFSSIEDGPDMAVEFSGWIRTLDGPVYKTPEWKVHSTDVLLKDDGDLHVIVNANENLTIFIVIYGIGSFLLDQIELGSYKSTIPGSNFEKGKRYEFHFSDSEDGEDLAPSQKGSFKTKDKEKEGTSLLPFLLIGLALICLIIGISIMVVWISRRSGKEEIEGFEE